MACENRCGLGEFLRQPRPFVKYRPRGMPARQVWHVGGKDAADEWPRWTASISSTQGNWVAMHHHGYNQ